MKLPYSTAAKARKEREAAEAAAQMRMVRQRASDRIKDLKSKQGASAARTIGAELRRWPRTSAFNVATAVLDTGAEVTCRVIDVSFGGMRVEFVEGTAPQTEFGLTVPTLRFVGIVHGAWSSGAQAGVEILRWRESA